MPRAPRPEGLRILDYFRTADLGEAKVIAQLAAEVIAQRLTITTAEVPNPAASRPATSFQPNPGNASLIGFRDDETKIVGAVCFAPGWSIKVGSSDSTKEVTR